MLIGASKRWDVADDCSQNRQEDFCGSTHVVGGIIPPEDAEKLAKAGVARVYTPKDFDLNAIMADIVEIVRETTMEAA